MKELKEYSRSLRLLGLKITSISNTTETKTDLRPRRCSSSTGWSDVKSKIQTRQIYRTTSMDDVARIIPQLNKGEKLASVVLDQKARAILNRAIYEEWYDKSMEASKREKNKRMEKKRQETSLEDFPRNLKLLGLSDTCDSEDHPKWSKIEVGPPSRKSSRVKFRSTSLEDLIKIIPKLKDQSNIKALKLDKEERKFINQLVYEKWIKKKNKEEKMRAELRKLEEEIKTEPNVGLSSRPTYQTSEPDSVLGCLSTPQQLRFFDQGTQTILSIPEESEGEISFIEEYSSSSVGSSN